MKTISNIKVTKKKLTIIVIDSKDILIINILACLAANLVFLLDAHIIIMAHLLFISFGYNIDCRNLPEIRRILDSS